MNKTLEQVTAIFGETLEQLRRYYDWCEGATEEDADASCTCGGCQAKYALDQVGDWRVALAKVQAGVADVEPIDTNQRGFGSELPDRLAWHARERRLVGAFLGETTRRYFEHIIGFPPTVRDWSVALSVIRWIGTNVGSSVLETAGWRYDRYKEDSDRRAPLSLFRLTPIAEQWAQGIGWFLGVAESTLAIKDRQLKALAAPALTAVRAVYKHLIVRLDRPQPPQYPEPPVRGQQPAVPSIPIGSGWPGHGRGTK